MQKVKLPKPPYELEKDVINKVKQIKLALFDVDGVLTDGKLYYGPSGEELKVFNALDGHGLRMLQMAGIDVGVISARRSAALKKRLNDLGIKHCYLGVNNKLDTLKRLTNDLGVDIAQCSFTGDDVIDLEVMRACGAKFSVKNGHFIVQSVADWVAPLMGGSGAVRAICDVILYYQKNYPVNVLPPVK